MKKTVEEIYQLFTGLEKDSSDGVFNQQLLEELVNLIASLEKSDDIILQKLSKYKNSLTPQMTIRHFSTIAVPFERYLKKNITDDDFLISSTDRDHLVMPRAPLHFVLDNLRSAFNVGSVFRTADTLGASKIWLTGYTPTPHQLQVEKAALGSTFVMAWEQSTFLDCIQKLRDLNIQIVALETTSRARDITLDFDFTKPTAFIIGNERFGLDTTQLEYSDDIRKIPTYGIKNSLNASVAAALAGFEWRKQYNETLHTV
jgi:23S rRNA (guanosine2251-2'-O)-methyltransferase